MVVKAKRKPPKKNTEKIENRKKADKETSFVRNIKNCRNVGNRKKKKTQKTQKNRNADKETSLVRNVKNC